MNRFLRKTRVLSKLGFKTLEAKLFNKRNSNFFGFYITNTCNLRCTYCFHNVENRYDDKSRPDPKTEEVLRQVDEIIKIWAQDGSSYLVESLWFIKILKKL